MGFFTNSLIMQGVNQAAQRIQNVQRDSLIGHWILNDTELPVVKDFSGRGHNGAYQGSPTLGVSGPDAGNRAVRFDGSDQNANLYSAALAALFNGLECSLVVSMRFAAAQWVDTTNRVPIHFGANGSTNFIRIMSPTADNTIQCTYVAGGSSKQVVFTTSLTSWIQIGMTISAVRDEIKGYLNGALQGTTTGLGTYVGSLGSNTTMIGAQTATGALDMLGDESNGALWAGAVLSPKEMLYMYDGTPIT